LPEQLKERHGKVKIRVFALLLMLVSCSIIISAYRSLSRDFSGVVIRKTATSGIASTQYQLHLLPVGSNFDPELLKKALSDPGFPLQRVGVSAFVYEQAQTMESVDKDAMSVKIMVGDSAFIDLGFFWIMCGLAGILISIWMYLQTCKNNSGSEDKNEDIEIPGLD
jgi:hypothetical protein